MGTIKNGNSLVFKFGNDVLLVSFDPKFLTPETLKCLEKQFILGFGGITIKANFSKETIAELITELKEVKKE